MQIRKEMPGFSMVFEIPEDGIVRLVHFDNRPMVSADTQWSQWYHAADIHLTGENQDANHGGKHIGSSSMNSLKYISHIFVKTPSGEQLQICLKDEKTEVTLFYEFYDGIPAVRSWNCIKNISHQPIGLEYVGSFSLMAIEQDTPETDLRVLIPHNYWTMECNWKSYTLSQLGFYRVPGCATKRIAYSNTGTWSTKEYLPMGGLQRNGSMLLWQIENNGAWHWELSDLPCNLYLKLSGPTELENGWHKTLKPEECFESVKSAVVVGDNFNEALAAMTQYRRRIVQPTAMDRGMPVIFNDYMNCLKADPTTEKEIPVIDRAAELGAEYYCIDAGWYADGTWWETVGEWQPCQWRFPDGLAALIDYIRSKNMIPGLWLEIEVMGIHCPILDQFTDDCFFMRHGKRVIDHGRYQLDFRHPKVRSFATDVIDRIVTEYGVGYLKMDYNIDIGVGTQVDADSCGDGLLSANRAYLSWIDEIREKYPDLIIEHCSSGGMRLDYAMLSRFPIASVSDQTKCTQMTHIAQGAVTALLPEQAAIWAYPVRGDSDNIIAMNMVNAMLLRLHLSGEVMHFDDEQLTLVREGIDCYKQIRHIITESIPFFPLGMPNYDERTFCAGFTGIGRTFLKVWRLTGGGEELHIPVNGRQARVVYPRNSTAILTGTQDRLTVRLPEENSAVILEI